MPGNSNFSTILSTTLNNYNKTLTDNIFEARPLGNWLMEKGRLKLKDGGVKIIEPLIYGAGQSGSYSGYDQITITPQDGISAAEFDWRQVYATIAISGIEEAQNNGKSEVLDLLEAKIMQAEETLKDDVNDMLWSDGTGNSNKDWLGLQALVSGYDEGGTPAIVGVITVGNINATTGQSNDWWRSVILGDADGTPIDLSLGELSRAYNSSSKGNDHVDAIFTTQTLFEAYEGLLLPTVQRSHAKSADAGFDNLLFKGKPIFYDEDCPSGQVFGINSKYLKLVGHKDRWFKNSGFTENTASNHASTGASVVTDARYALITAYGNLTMSNRARHFRMVNYQAPA